MKKIHGAKTIIFMPILKHSIANSVSFPVPWVKWRYIQAERDRGTETAKTQFAIILGVSVPPVWETASPHMIADRGILN